MLTSIISMNAQNYIYVWHTDGSIDVSSLANTDSVTFSITNGSVTLSTGDPTEVSAHSMTAYCVAKSPNFQGSATEIGICFSTLDKEPNTANLRAINGQYKAGTWKTTIEKLDSGRTYYYRAYAILGAETYYGPVKNFTTKGDSSIGRNTPEAIDLGLSAKWASFNLGATKPEEYGDYFAWGETAPKDCYTWENYKYGDGKKWIGSNYYTKYNKEDKLGTLVPDDDAATVNLGYPWHIPTKDELDELIEKCTWNWETLNSKKGYRVIGPNGNTIFLPAAGSSNSNYQEDGCYWSSSRSVKYENDPYTLHFYNSIREWRSFNFCDGVSVRPVRP
jgi:hypothetical protein